MKELHIPVSWVEMTETPMRSEQFPFIDVKAANGGMEYIRVTQENLEKEHICCAISMKTAAWM